MASYEQAIKWLDEGKKIRRTRWQPDWYYYWNHSTEKYYDERGEFCLSPRGLLTNDWELYAPKEEKTCESLKELTAQLNDCKKEMNRLRDDNNFLAERHKKLMNDIKNMTYAQMVLHQEKNALNNEITKLKEQNKVANEQANQFREQRDSLKRLVFEYGYGGYKL